MRSVFSDTTVNSTESEVILSTCDSSKENTSCEQTNDESDDFNWDENPFGVSGDFYKLFRFNMSISFNEEEVKFKQKYYNHLAKKSKLLQDKKKYIEKASELNLHLGLKKDGTKKPPTCWKYVFSKYCNCNNTRYHPEEEERLYLKRIKTKNN